MKNNIDFRLNKAEISAFIELLLDYASRIATNSSNGKVEFVIKPGTKPNFKYGQHNNAQETNNFLDYDKSSAEIFYYKNGYFAGSFWMVLRFDNFTARFFYDNLITKLISNEELLNFYNTYLYYIFGESYKKELLSFYEQNKIKKLKDSDDQFKTLLQQARNQNSKRKASLRYNHNQIRNDILSYYDNQIDAAQNMSSDFLASLHNQDF